MIRDTLRALAVQLYNDAIDAAAPLVRDAAEVVHDATWGAMLWASKRSVAAHEDTRRIAEAKACAHCDALRARGVKICVCGSKLARDAAKGPR